MIVVGIGHASQTKITDLHRDETQHDELYKNNSSYQTLPHGASRRVSEQWALGHDLEVTGGVEQEVGRLQVAVQDVGRVDVLQPTEDLVEEVADVVVAQVLGLQELVQVGLHEVLDDVSARLHVKELVQQNTQVENFVPAG